MEFSSEFLGKFADANQWDLNTVLAAGLASIEAAIRDHTALKVAEQVQHGRDHAAHDVQDYRDSIIDKLDGIRDDYARGALDTLQTAMTVAMYGPPVTAHDCVDGPGCPEWTGDTAPVESA